MQRFDAWTSDLAAIREPIKPMQEQGVSGTPNFGGFVANNERNPKAGSQRYDSAEDIIRNASVVASGMRFFINLVSRPKWTFMPAGEAYGETPTAQAKEVAQFVTYAVANMTDSWPRCVRRMAAARFYGFGIHEWTMKKDEDGQIILASLEPRPWQTIQRWDVDLKGAVLGVEQRSPEYGDGFYIPRGKFVYLVDDAFTDSPEGLGLWRHLLEPYERYKAYLQIEAMGFERDLRGIPIGYVPYKKLSQMVTSGDITQEQMDALVAPIEKFVKLAAKGKDTSACVDSSTYSAINDTGEAISTSQMFDIKLLSASGNGMADIGNAIDRIRYDMATIIGTENLLIGSGDAGSRALSENKSRDLYLNADACLNDVVSAVQRDLIPPLMIYNNIPRELWPTAKAESAAYTDPVKKSQLLVNLAQAGATTSNRDPAVSELRAEVGLSAVTEEMMSMDSLDAMNDEVI